MQKLKTDLIKVLQKELPAVSIVESMVAMVLIILSFGAGMAIFLQVMTTDKISSKTKARVLLNRVLAETKYTATFIDETIEESGLTIEKKILPNAFATDTYIISLRALDPKYQQLVEVREIIYWPQL